MAKSKESESPVSGPNIYYFDIETTPNVSYTWGKWEQDVIAFKKHWGLLCFASKFSGEETKVYSLKDYTNEKALVLELWKQFDKADIIIAHNGDSFDIKKANTLFLKHGLKKPSGYKSIDTKLVAKRYFRFDSNKLDDLSDYLGLGRKVNTGGFDLWLGCMAGDAESWEHMETYNKQDVDLLEKIYLKFRPYMENHPNFNVYSGTTHNCPNCGSEKTQKRGFGYTKTGKYQRHQCLVCGGWSKGDNIKINKVIA